MKKEQSRITYTVGFVHGAVFDAGDDVARGEVRDGVDVNKAAVFQATNRAEILGNSKDDKKALAASVEDFKARVTGEDKELKKQLDEKLASGANLAAQVKALQSEIASMRKAV
ncbi:MAG: hypothetical protein ACR2Q3_01590 [Woeseiaceae bacterium]